MFIGFLGLGQCGGSICDVASREGLVTGVINYSLQDLNSLKYAQNKLHLVGSEGVGRSREVAMSLMESNWDLATNFVKTHFSHPSIKLIFVPFASGGGSGSGIAPVLLSMLTQLMPEKTFVAMPILPDLQEVYKNQINCLQLFENLTKIDVSILPLDNERGRASLSNVGRVGLYSHMNEKVVNLIKSIAKYTDTPSPYSVLDKNDLINIFKVKGLATISECTINTNSDNFNQSQSELVTKIQESWNKSLFSEIETEKIIHSGIIIEGNRYLIENLNSNSLFSVFKNTSPVALYEGIYENNEENRVISILSGLSICKNRLNKIEELIENKHGDVLNFEQNSDSYTSKIKPVFATKTNHEKPVQKVNDISDLIKKFK